MKIELYLVERNGEPIKIFFDKLRAEIYKNAATMVPEQHNIVKGCGVFDTPLPNKPVERKPGKDRWVLCCKVCRETKDQCECSW